MRSKTGVSLVKITLWREKMQSVSKKMFWMTWAVLVVILMMAFYNAAFATEKPQIELGYGAYISGGQGNGPVISVKADIPKTKLNLLYMQVEGLSKTDEYTIIWWTGNDNTAPGQAWFTTRSKFEFVGLGIEKTHKRLSYGVNAGPAWISQTFHSKARTPQGDIYSGFLTFHSDVTRLGIHIPVSYKLSNFWIATAGYTWPGKSDLQGFDIQARGSIPF